MALLPIITAPDPRLKTVATRVDAVDDDIRRLMDDMLETMYAAPGVGLAAPQASSTRSTISTVCCSSTISPVSSAG